MEGGIAGVVTTAYGGYVVYVVVAALLVLFAARMRGRSLDELMAAATDEHHRVHRVIARHPRGGDWRSYRRWLDEAA